MNISEFYQLVENPALLNAATVHPLKQLVDSYPCFPAARLLYLKNLALLDDLGFEAGLKQMAIAIPDRKQLFMLISGDDYGFDQTVQPTADSGSFSLIDAFVADLNTEPAAETEKSLLFQPSTASDYLHWSLTGDAAVTQPDKSEEKHSKLKHQELIDSFIETEELRSPANRIASMEESATGQKSSGAALPAEEAKKSLDDSYFTETLAHIYVKQRRYDKALQIIKNLSLNYPEKNVYFADQIRFLEKLIINTKK